MVKLDQPLSRPQTQKEERADWLERLIAFSRSLNSTLSLPPVARPHRHSGARTDPDGMPG